MHPATLYARLRAVKIKEYFVFDIAGNNEDIWYPLLQITSRLWQWTNFENRLVFDNVMHEILQTLFSGHGV